MNAQAAKSLSNLFKNIMDRNANKTVKLKLPLSLLSRSYCSIHSVEAFRCSLATVSNKYVS